jgi:poly(3-hydroxybutyrate) depolymerase
VESARSAGVTASTTSGFVCTTTTASNYAHVTAGRAHNSGGYALANGSNQNMGLNNTFYTSTLAQTAAGYYVIGNCP